MSEKKYIKTIIFGNHKPTHIGLAIFGCLTGFFLILVSTQSIINFKNIFSDSAQGIGSQYMVINKRVGLLGSLKISKTSFSKNELNEFSKHPAIEKFSAFVGNDFEAEAYLELKEEGHRVNLKTDLFLESVEDDFIDAELDQWKWNARDPQIPIILPSDFINLYNFTYAPVRGLPQLSKSTVKFFGLSINMKGKNDCAVFNANIVGFSDRITSIIVPISFMEYANKRFGNENKNNTPSVYRIITKIKPEKLSSFQKFLFENNYETNQELLKNGKLLSLIYLIIFIIFIIGLIITSNAFTGFILYFNLLIYRSKDDIDSLLRLGYMHNRLIKNYMAYISLILFVIIILALGGLIWSQSLISKMLFKYGFEMPEAIHVYPLLGITVVTGILLLIFYIQIRNEIFKIALPTK